MNEKISNFYDEITPFYRQYSEKKLLYLKSVDEFIIKNIINEANSLLEIGAGDGIRGMNIAKLTGIKNIVLNDNSEKMIEKCRELSPKEVWQCDAEDLEKYNKKFDIVTCLWNVLGHLKNQNCRIKALKNIKSLLNKDGIAFIDVNNRYNAESYGYFQVFKRIIHDFFIFNETNGDTNYFWEIEGNKINAMGHLFTPFEIENLIKKSGLRIYKKVIVNYDNGRITNCYLKGQLIYILKI